LPVVSVPSATELAAIVVDIEASAEPLKETEPVTSPVRDIVLAVRSCDAVSAFPTNGAVTAAKVTDDEVETA